VRWPTGRVENSGAGTSTTRCPVLPWPAHELIDLSRFGNFPAMVAIYLSGLQVELSRTARLIAHYTDSTAQIKRCTDILWLNFYFAEFAPVAHCSNFNCYKC
jgi:hypothetical protein